MANISLTELESQFVESIMERNTIDDDIWSLYDEKFDELKDEEKEDTPSIVNDSSNADSIFRVYAVSRKSLETSKRNPELSLDDSDVSSFIQKVITHYNLPYSVEFIIKSLNIIFTRCKYDGFIDEFISADTSQLPWLRRTVLLNMLEHELGQELFDLETIKKLNAALKE